VTRCYVIGSTRVSRVGFGVAPKQSFILRRWLGNSPLGKVRDGEDAIASTRDARSPQTFLKRFVRFAHVARPALEAREVLEEGERNVSDWAVSLLCDD
jgi:hypothetical protein